MLSSLSSGEPATRTTGAEVGRDSDRGVRGENMTARRSRRNRRRPGGGPRGASLLWGRCGGLLAAGAGVDPDAHGLVVAVDGQQLAFAAAGEGFQGGVEVELVA